MIIIYVRPVDYDFACSPLLVKESAVTVDAIYVHIYTYIDCLRARIFILD